VDPSKFDVEDIFCAAMELAAPAERSAYLDQACGDDLATRRRVERLLAAQSQAGSFLCPAPSVVTATYEFLGSSYFVLFQVLNLLQLDLGACGPLTRSGTTTREF
jgi:hypothetical protein